MNVSIKLTSLILILFSINHGNCQVKDTIINTIIKNGLIATNNPDSVIHYLWDVNDQNWNPEKRYTFSYNNGRKILEETSNWNVDTWEATDKIDYIFEAGLLVQQLNSWWDWPYSEWTPTKQYDIKYDSANYPIEILISKYLFESSTRVNDSVYSYEYDSLGNLLVFTERIWSNSMNIWEDYSQIIYIYDGLSNNTKQIIYKWDADLEIWQYEKITNFIYNSTNLLIEQEQLVINSFRTEWINNWKKEYTYYSNGLIKNEVFFVWGLIDGDFKWIANFSDSYSYDASYNLIEINQYYYDWDLLLWINQFQILNTYYDADLLNTSSYYYWNYGRWNQLEKYTYYYSGYVSVHSIAEATTINIYPNPVKEKLNISLGKENLDYMCIELFDLKGSCLFVKQESQMGSLVEIALPLLPNGLYMLKIVLENEVVSKKLVISN